MIYGSPYWEAAQCSCCHTTDQRGFLDRLGVGGGGGGGGGRQRGLAGGEREGRSRRSEVNLMKPDALTSAGSALRT